MTKAKCTPEMFVRAWQVARSPREVALRFGMHVKTVTRRAHEYRKKGVNLKKFGRVEGNLSYLNEIAKAAKG